MFTLIFLSVSLAILTVSYLVFRPRKKKSIAGKIALVSGGANGLGREICLKLASLGCNIAIADVDLLSAQSTVEKVINLGVRGKAYKVDVSSFSEITQLKQKISLDLGEVDILVNNAGLIAYKTIFEQSSDELERMTSVNLNSVLLMTKCFLEGMIERNSGHVVAISSLQGIYAFPYSLAYSASKFGVTGFMLGLIDYLRVNKLDDVHATCIFPNVIATRDDVIKAVNAKVVRVLKPEDVAEAVVEAIVKNKRLVSLPFYSTLAISIFNVLPFWLQHLIRDHIYLESSFLNH